MTDTSHGGGTNGGSEAVPHDAREYVKELPEREGTTVYANSVYFRTTFWDFSLDFDLVVDNGMERVVVQDVVTVTLSPQYAKAMARGMTRYVEMYEETYGPIPTPPGAGDTDQ